MLHHLDNFDRLSYCESNHEAHLNTGNGYYGAFQFDKTTWNNFHSGFASDFSYKVQKATAKKLQHERGWQPWPGCSQKLGL